LIKPDDSIGQSWVRLQLFGHIGMSFDAHRQFVLDAGYSSEPGFSVSRCGARQLDI
jgi:hypothetical protein